MSARLLEPKVPHVSTPVSMESLSLGLIAYSCALLYWRLRAESWLGFDVLRVNALVTVGGVGIKGPVPGLWDRGVLGQGRRGLRARAQGCALAKRAKSNHAKRTPGDAHGR